MDINQLAKALQISADFTERTQNEVKFLENYAPALLNIACDSNNRQDVQINAAIQLKNYIQSNWKFTNNENLNQQLKFEDNEQIIEIKSTDKEYVKAHILDALVYSTSNLKLMKQFNQAIKKIVKLDFENWKEFLVSKILEFFQSGDDNKTFAGIIAFYQISKVFEFESGSYKESYKKSFEIVNPSLLLFLNGLVPKLDNQHAALIVYKIFKIFYKSIQLDVSPLIRDATNFENWNMYCITAIRFDLSKEYKVKTEKTDEIEELSKSIFWKLKKLCFQIIYRTYQKYGYSETTDKVEWLNFAKLIEGSYVKVYFEVCLETLYRSKTEFVSDFVLCLIYKFMSQMLVRYHLVEEIEKHLDNILKEHIVQNAMITMKDLELWQSDPKTYINKQFDITENYYITRYSVCQFIKTLCTFKRKNEKGKAVGPCIYYEPTYKYLVSILELYEDEVSKGNNTDVRIKESVLYIIQSIAPSIMAKSKETIEQIIRLFILKEFDSKFAFLRERACTFIECFGDHKYTDNELLTAVTTKVCFILDQETDLPVKVMAAISTPELLKNQGVKELLTPHVPKLLEIYLNLINTIDLEEILDGLETIISRFNHQVKDYAVALTFELIKLFRKLVSSEEAEDGKGEKLMVIEGVLRTVLKIIELFINNAEIYPQIESSVNEMIIWGLQGENFEHLDDTLDFIHTILKKGNTVSQKTWEFFPEIINCLIGSEEEIKEFQQNYPNVEFEGLGYEHIQDIIPIICYFIIKDPNTFLTGVDKYSMSYLTKSILLVQRIMSLAKSKKEYHIIQYAFKVLIVILETFKGKIDDIAKEIIGFLVNDLSKEKIKQTYKMALLETIAACFYYNPVITIQVVESKNFVERLFTIWLSSLTNFKFEHEKKRCLLAFTSIIMVNPEQQNKDIIKNIHLLLSEIINLAEDLDKKKKKKFENEAVEVAEEEQTDEGREEMLNRLIAKAKGSTLNDFKAPEEGDDDLIEEEEEEEDEEWDEFSHLSNITPVDKLDEIIHIKEAFGVISQGNAAYYQQLMNLIDNDSKVRLETCIKNAENRHITGSNIK